MLYFTHNLLDSTDEFQDESLWPVLSDWTNLINFSSLKISVGQLVLSLNGFTEVTGIISIYTN